MELGPGRPQALRLRFVECCEADEVAIARVPLSAGQTLRIGGAEIAVKQSIPPGHKVAIRPIAEGAELHR
ncbi:MAG TPA: SAF domain-containing protein, partial [Solirubrobacteraceae bacterium]|nr:SAF domain-containing protein [Solirubrobacteraceae bacterium]